MIASAPSRQRASGIRQEQGVALVLVLIFSVLLAGLVVAYFSRVTVSRQLSNSSVNQNKADQLARSAADIVISGFKQEIADPSNSTAMTVGSGATQSTIYSPKSAANLLPLRAYPSLASGSDPILNLLRISSNTSNPPAPAVGSNASAVNSETAVSNNGRYITRARWNKHLFIPQLSANVPTDTTPIKQFTSPDWVMVTDQGPTVLTAGSKSVVGRYAYAVYDEGGLLDANVAGYPSGATAAQFGGKSATAYADLSQLGSPGLPTSISDGLVGWRNYATTKPGGTFPNFILAGTAPANAFFDMVTGNASGFLKANTAVSNNRTDQMFVSRQQLISYAQNAQWGTSNPIATPYLQYFSTFSRALNAPTWRPSTPAGSSIDYATQKDNSGTSNRDLIKVRVTQSFLRADGTTAQVGEPLLKSRFPLNRLGGLSYNGIVTTGNTTMLNGSPSPASEETVRRDFGLVWNSSGGYWDYDGPTGNVVQNTIAKLGDIGDRQPNFFELLKAGMLSGSLGRDAGSTGTFYVSYEEGPASGQSADSKNVDFQIIQIGANIIDQFDSDSYPTEIHFGNDANQPAFYGVEDLPYLQRIFAKTLHPDPKNGSDYISGYYMAELWDPHQKYTATPAPDPAPPSPPQKYRFSARGLSTMWSHTSGPEITGSLMNMALSGSIDFTATPDSLRYPTLLSNDSNMARHVNPIVLSGSNGTNDPYSAGFIAGLYSGRVAAAEPGNDFGGISPQGCDMLLSYQIPSGGYRIYQVMKNLIGKQQGSADKIAYYYQNSDPRCDRFGTALGIWQYHAPPYNQPSHSTRDDTNGGWNSYDYFPRPSSGFHYLVNADDKIFNSFFMGMLSDNTVGGNPYYSDPDGVTRRATGAYSGGNLGRPMMEAKANFDPMINRSIVLNRPFKNAGELGYVFRDEPFKSIDFFTDNSGDTGLLDIFCVRETANENAVVAGKVNLNTRQAPVLQAILSGATDAQETASAMTSADAAKLAKQFVASTSGGSPLLSPGDLASQTATILVGSAPEDQQLERRRETGLRALAEAGDARTWTFMIDVVAQAGRYAPGQTNLSKFIVEGEKRYWVHVAIDRYTGQVIDQTLEQVYE